MRERQQNSTTHPITFLLVSSTDHITPVTGAAPTVTLSKDGGAFAAAAGAVSEIANGWYALAGNAADRATLGGLIVHATATGADPFDGQFTIVPWDPFDAKLGIGAIPATGVIPTVGTGTNQIALTSGAVTAGTVSDKTGYTVSTVQDKTGYSVSTVLDKTGYTLAQAFPANFATQVIDTNGKVAVAGLLTLDTGTTNAGGTATQFTATGASLNASNGAYGGQSLRFSTGALNGEKRPILTHTVSGSTHTFIFASPGFTAAPGADPFVIA